MTIFILCRNVHYEFGEVLSAHKTEEGAKAAAGRYPGAKLHSDGGWTMNGGTEDLEIVELELQPQ